MEFYSHNFISNWDNYCSKRLIKNLRIFIKQFKCTLMENSNTVKLIRHYSVYLLCCNYLNRVFIYLLLDENSLCLWCWYLHLWSKFISWRRNKSRWILWNWFKCWWYKIWWSHWCMGSLICSPLRIRSISCCYINLSCKLWLMWLLEWRLWEWLLDWKLWEWLLNWRLWGWLLIFNRRFLLFFIRLFINLE